MTRSCRKDADDPVVQKDADDPVVQKDADDPVVQKDADDPVVQKDLGGTGDDEHLPKSRSADRISLPSNGEPEIQTTTDAPVADPTPETASKATPDPTESKTPHDSKPTSPISPAEDNPKERRKPNRLASLFGRKDRIRLPRGKKKKAASEAEKAPQALSDIPKASDTLTPIAGQPSETRSEPTAPSPSGPKKSCQATFRR